MSKKNNILTSAVQLLAEKGVHNTPMSAIAKAAGTGMGTIYNYFATKEILINEIYVNIKSKEKSVYADFDSKRPIKTQFECYVTALIQFFVDNPVYFRFMEQLQASPIITEESKKSGEQSLTTVYELLEKGKKERIIKQISNQELISFVGGAILSYLRWYFNQPTNTTISETNQMTMIWDAIKE